MQKLRIGITGYGNIGRGVLKAAAATPDIVPVAVFTRRDPGSLDITYDGVAAKSVDDAPAMRGELDVMLLCGGSATDLIEQGPHFAAMFNTVDSFDTHAKIPEYLAAMDKAATSTAAIISAGWDPGLFSIARALSGAYLPDGSDYTFWGYGVSQGHSDAIRRIEGVKNAVQYTVPVEDAVSAVRGGTCPVLTAREKHRRECFVVAQQGADTAQIAAEIKSMPNYFADYDTSVTFIDEAEFNEKHRAMPHGGSAIRTGRTGENRHMIELSLKLDSNPEFTGSIMLAYARAAARYAREGCFGAKTVLDVPATYLTATDRLDLIRDLL